MLGANELLHSLASMDYLIQTQTLGGIKMLKRPTKDLEVNLNDGSTVYAFPNASFSLLDDGKDDDKAVDVITTLENYYDHQYLAKYELEIINDGTIYEAPLKDVFDMNKFYGYMKKYEAMECE